MEYNLLGPTGVKVSKICLGTATFGVAPDVREAGRVVGRVPYAPLHGGLLASTDVQHRGVHGDQRFGGPGFTGPELDIGRSVERLSREWGLPPYRVSLAWLLSHPAVASAIVGAETVEEVTANATAADVVLDPTQLDALTTVGTRVDPA
jgi:aryl-alcohol dehydrogenase-like predicted oxidoreductase